MGFRRAAAVVVSALLAAGLAACAPAAASLPSGVTVSIDQNRSDYGARIIALRVMNGTNEPIELLRATLDSPRLASTTAWDRGTTLRAGAVVDLRVTLPAADCAGDERPPTVTLDFVTSDGSAGSGTLIPHDPTARLAAIDVEDCLVEAVRSTAPIEAGRPLNWMPGAAAPASLELSVTPTGGDGSYSVTGIDDTTLLAIVDADGARPAETAFDVAGSDAASTVTVRFVPNRCDPHAVLEDKRGTFLPLRVRDEAGSEGIVFVGVTDAVRGEIYDWVNDYCGYETGG